MLLIQHVGSVDRNTSHVTFLMHLAHVITHFGSRCLSAHFTPSTCHPGCHMFERAFVVSSCLSLFCFSPTSTLSLSLSTCSLSGTPSSTSSPPRGKSRTMRSIAPRRKKSSHRERERIEFYNKNGSVPGGTSFKRGRQAVFFPTENPLEDGYGSGKHVCHLQNVGSCRTRILGNDMKIQYFGATWSSPKRELCNFTKRGQMQSFFTTHCLQLALRKRYV